VDFDKISLFQELSEEFADAVLDFEDGLVCGCLDE
jgi:hypothetical protein